jgi:hypothetical protein
MAGFPWHPAPPCPQGPYDRGADEFIDSHDWITSCFLPAYAPHLNPVEGI